MRQDTHMISIPKMTSATTDKPSFYGELQAAVAALIDGERDFLANIANVASLLFHTMPDINWSGFYLIRGGELVLGPFQGKPACVRIALGQGVCGTAAHSQKTVVVANVHEFPGHIACDSASRSEIVLPLLAVGRLLGVLDLDSPVEGRFDNEDAVGLEAIVDLVLDGSELSSYG